VESVAEGAILIIGNGLIGGIEREKKESAMRLERRWDYIYDIDSNATSRDSRKLNRAMKLSRALGSTVYDAAVKADQ
jgi:hypothetical protein